MEEPYDDERQRVKNKLEHAIIRVNNAMSDRDHCVDQSKKASECLATAQHLQQQIERELNDLNTIDSIIGLLKRLTLPEQLIRQITSDIKQALPRHEEHTPQPLAHSDTEETARQTDKESETEQRGEHTIVTSAKAQSDRQAEQRDRRGHTRDERSEQRDRKREAQRDRQAEQRDREGEHTFVTSAKAQRDRQAEQSDRETDSDREGEHTDDDIVRYLGSLDHICFGSRVSVYYPEYGEWYDGTVKPYTPGKSSEKDLEKARESGLFKVLFDSEHWCDINMLQVDFKDLEEKKRKKSKR